MNSKRSNKSAILCTAISVMLATLAAETSAQAGSIPARQLSDAVAEVLRSPFHVHRAPLGPPGQGLLLSAVGYPSAAQGPTAGLSMGLPNTGAQEAGTSTDRLVGMTTFGAVASHLATAFFLRCQASPGGPFGVPGATPGPAGREQSAFRPASAGTVVHSLTTTVTWWDRSFSCWYQP